MNIYSINGYWLDNKKKFKNYLVTDSEEALPDWCNYKDEDIFIYGIDVVNLPKIPAEIFNEFVIESFKFVEIIETETTE